MANVKITDLTAATALGGSELFECVQSSTSVKASATQIKNFANDSVSIVGGTLSSVTISNATGSFNSITISAGTVPFNTITNRAYAQFESTRDQSATSANVTYVASFDTAASFNTGITVASSTNITVAAAGVYQITASAQFYNANSVDHDAIFWFTRNGNNINNSASTVTVPKAADGGQYMAQVTIFEQCSANDYINFVWRAEDIDVRLDYTAASGTVTAIPSVIMNVVRIG
jgi:hypothetical protein